MYSFTLDDIPTLTDDDGNHNNHNDHNHNNPSVAATKISRRLSQQSHSHIVSQLTAKYQHRFQQQQQQQSNNNHNRHLAANSHTNNAKLVPATSLRILLYSGEFDLNCNTLGTLHTLEHQHWRRQ
jgi:hypothetical protein